MKITKDDVRLMFKMFLKAANKQQAPIMINDNRDNLNYYPGGWTLDYRADCGGWVIEEDGENGTISHPFGAQRRSTREMYLSMSMAGAALQLKNDDVITIEWHIQDVKDWCEELQLDLSDDQCKQVLHHIKDNHDCSMGITWDVIDHTIEKLFG